MISKSDTLFLAIYHIPKQKSCHEHRLPADPHGDLAGAQNFAVASGMRPAERLGKNIFVSRSCGFLSRLHPVRVPINDELPLTAFVLKSYLLAILHRVCNKFGDFERQKLCTSMYMYYPSFEEDNHWEVEKTSVSAIMFVVV